MYTHFFYETGGVNFTPYWLYINGRYKRRVHTKKRKKKAIITHISFNQNFLMVRATPRD
jgi:hypothetical protein